MYAKFPSTVLDDRLGSVKLFRCIVVSRCRRYFGINQYKYLTEWNLFYESLSECRWANKNKEKAQLKKCFPHFPASRTGTAFGLAYMFFSYESQSQAAPSRYADIVIFFLSFFSVRAFSRLPALRCHVLWTAVVVVAMRLERVWVSSAMVLQLQHRLNGF